MSSNTEKNCLPVVEEDSLKDNSRSVITGICPLKRTEHTINANCSL